MRPTITRVLETGLYVENLERAVEFYREVLGCTVMFEGHPRLVAMDAGQASVLLLFRRGAAADGLTFPGGWIPPHDGAGQPHLAFAIPAGTFEAWERWLRDHGVAIESQVTWGRGGRSLYLRDPDGHSVELATPGTWAVY